MTKLTFRYFAGFALLTAGCWLLMQIYQSVQAKKRQEVSIQSLAHICFDALGGGQICIDEFNSNQPTIIIYFHPECEHCQYEASEIGKQPEQFKKINTILITPDDSTQRVEAFAVRYHLWEVDNLTILMDRNHKFRYHFGTAVFPSAFIYGADKKLLKMYKGEIKISTILKWVI